MKKIFPLLLLVLLGVAAWFYSSGKTPSSTQAGSTNASNGTVRDDMINDINALGESGGEGAGSLEGSGANQMLDPGLNQEMFNAEGETKPASQFYANAADAFKAIQNGAKDYDDMILEQFTLPGDDCTWCPEVYKSVKDTLADPNLPTDQRSYFAEILAISGKIDNLAVLVDGIKNAASKEVGDTYAEALELTVGKDDVGQYLEEHMGSTNESLREASVAAVTNQGSRLSAEVLYKNTVER